MFRRILAASLFLSTAITADELSKTDISAKLQSLTAAQGNPVVVKDIEQSDYAPFYRIITDNGILYSDKSGEYLFSGSVYNLAPGMTNLTQKRLEVEHQKTIERLKPDFITYKAPNQQHEVMVFYDVSCGYCHKLHSEISKYNALGITIHYAAYPRNGIFDPRSQSPTNSFIKLQNIWCSEKENRNLVFDMVARGANTPTLTCQNTIPEQYAMGQSFGIDGTPFIYTLDGKRVAPGYVSAKQLQIMLQQAQS